MKTIIMLLLSATVTFAAEPPLMKQPPMMGSVVTVMQKVTTTEKTLVQLCHGKYCTYEWRDVQVTKEVPVQVIQDNDDGAAPTPQVEVERVLALLPKPKIGFVDYGCGADARWCIAAAKRWGCQVTGVEIDSTRATAAKERVRASGLSRLVTIIEGDAITTNVEADVGVAYLYADVLEKLKTKIEKMQAFASYMHQPPGLSVTKNGDSWIYIKSARWPVDKVQNVDSWKPTAAVWNGQLYSQPMCNSPNCAMCNTIRAQLK